MFLPLLLLQLFLSIVAQSSPDEGLERNDFSVYREIPSTNFRCENQQWAGYYSDPEADCQVFHICVRRHDKLEQFSFLCPDETIFHQELLVCVWLDSFDCSSSPSLYYLNEAIFEEFRSQGLEAQVAKSQGKDIPESISFGPEGRALTTGKIGVPTLDSALTTGKIGVPTLDSSLTTGKIGVPTLDSALTTDENGIPTLGKTLTPRIITTPQSKRPKPEHISQTTGNNKTVTKPKTDIPKFESNFSAEKRLGTEIKHPTDRKTFQSSGGNFTTGIRRNDVLSGRKNITTKEGNDNSKSFVPKDSSKQILNAQVRERLTNTENAKKEKVKGNNLNSRIPQTARNQAQLSEKSPRIKEQIIQTVKGKHPESSVSRQVSSTSKVSGTEPSVQSKSLSLSKGRVGADSKKIVPQTTLSTLSQFIPRKTNTGQVSSRRRVKPLNTLRNSLKNEKQNVNVTSESSSKRIKSVQETAVPQKPIQSTRNPQTIPLSRKPFKSINKSSKGKENVNTLSSRKKQTPLQSTTPPPVSRDRNVSKQFPSTATGTPFQKRIESTAKTIPLSTRGPSRSINKSVRRKDDVNTLSSSKKQAPFQSTNPPVGPRDQITSKRFHSTTAKPPSRNRPNIRKPSKALGSRPSKIPVTKHLSKGLTAYDILQDLIKNVTILRSEALLKPNLGSKRENVRRNRRVNESDTKILDTQTDEAISTQTYNIQTENTNNFKVSTAFALPSETERKRPTSKERNFEFNKSKIIPLRKEDEIPTSNSFHQSRGSGYLPSTSGYLPSTSGYLPRTSGYLPRTSGYLPRTSGYLPSTRRNFGVSNNSENKLMTCEYGYGSNKLSGCNFVESTVESIQKLGVSEIFANNEFHIPNPTLTDGKPNLYSKYSHSDINPLPSSQDPTSGRSAYLKENKPNSLKTPTAKHKILNVPGTGVPLTFPNIFLIENVSLPTNQYLSPPSVKIFTASEEEEAPVLIVSRADAENDRHDQKKVYFNTIKSKDKNNKINTKFQDPINLELPLLSTISSSSSSSSDYEKSSKDSVDVNTRQPADKSYSSYGEVLRNNSYQQHSYSYDSPSTPANEDGACKEENLFIYS